MLAGDTLTSDQKQNVTGQMAVMRTIKSDYQYYKGDGIPTQSRSGEPINTPVLASTAAVGAVIAYFYLNDYKLSADYLAHARIPRDPNDPNDYNNNAYQSVYSAERIRQSPVFQSIAASSLRSGSDAFPNVDEKFQKDLYYAIHLFDWSRAWDTMIAIEDVYDFEYDLDYGGIAGTAVNAMAVAQGLGVIIPFKVLEFVSPVQVSTAPVFSDVGVENQFYTEIMWMAAEGISSGWSEPDGTKTFRPLEPVARDAMAAFLYRAAGSPEFTAPTESPFTDVDTDSQFYKEIAWLASKGISTGWSDGTFRPLEPVARDAMAVFLYRAVNG